MDTHADKGDWSLMSPPFCGGAVIVVDFSHVLISARVLASDCYVGICMAKCVLCGAWKL